jgi:DNA-binding transcriptional MerR regulator
MNDVTAFNADQVMALTGLSARQLAYWDRIGFFPPHYSERFESGRSARLYSFRDLVGLRALAVLRNTHRVSLQELRKVHQQLVDRSESPWSEVTFYVFGNSVFFDDPETSLRMSGVKPGQRVVDIPMARVERDMRAAANRLRVRTPEEVGTVRQYRSVMSHAPVLTGTRIPTSAVWNFHQAGYDTAAIIAEYPSLTPEDVAAAIDTEQQRRHRAG